MTRTLFSALVLFAACRPLPPRAQVPPAIAEEKLETEKVEVDEPDPPKVGGSSGAIMAAAVISGLAALTSLAAYNDAVEAQDRASSILAGPDAFMRDMEYRAALDQRDSARTRAVLAGSLALAGVGGAIALGLHPQQEGSSGDIGLGLGVIEHRAPAVSLAAGFGGFVLPRLELRVGGTAMLGPFVGAGFAGPTAQLWLAESAWVGGGVGVGGACAIYGCENTLGGTLRAGSASRSTAVSLEITIAPELTTMSFMFGLRQGYSPKRHRERVRQYEHVVAKRAKAREARRLATHVTDAARSGDCARYDELSLRIKEADAGFYTRVYLVSEELERCRREAPARAEERARRQAAVAAERAACIAQRDAAFARATGATDPQERAEQLAAIVPCGDAHERAWELLRDAARAASSAECATVGRIDGELRELAPALRDGPFAHDPSIVECFRVLAEQNAAKAARELEECRQKRIDISRQAAAITDIKQRTHLLLTMPACDPP